MLTTLIYRSHISDFVPVKTLPAMVEAASLLNASHDVTGILLFNGTHFFQLLEGPEEGVLAIYRRICNDPRHHNVVELLRDFAPSRRFGNAGMALFDLREHHPSSVLEAVLDKGTSRYRLTYDDRALKFLSTFVESREKENYYEVQSADLWEFISEQPDDEAHLTASIPKEIALHPVVDPLARQITALTVSALRVEEHGQTGNELYQADFAALKQALATAGKICPTDTTLHVSLLPMTLVVIPEAVQAIVAEIKAAGLVPEQVMIGVSETRVISQLDTFSDAVRALKAAGISLSLDNFGSGPAGLSLLTRIQPDRISIDASITCNVHHSGPKQAVVQAIVRCCSALEISVMVTGITRAEEWMWLEATGIIHFQGALFSADNAHSPLAVAWPEYREQPEA